MLSCQEKNARKAPWDLRSSYTRKAVPDKGFVGSCIDQNVQFFAHREPGKSAFSKTFLRLSRSLRIALFMLKKTGASKTYQDRSWKSAAQTIKVPCGCG